MEKRAAPRKPVLMSGAIEFAGSTVNCLICDMSISGAALEVSNPADIPDQFDLFFKADSRFPVTSSGAKMSGSAWLSTSVFRSQIRMSALPPIANKDPAWPQMTSNSFRPHREGFAGQRHKSR
jgi:hypothetical protein